VSASQPVITVTQIGEYVRHHACERWFKLDVESTTHIKSLPYHATIFNFLDPVLREKGREGEDAWELSLKATGLKDLTNAAVKLADAKQTLWAEFIDAAAALKPGEHAYGREIELEVHVGQFRLKGRIDFVLVLWDGATPRLRLVECKSSRRDRTYQRLQVAIYRRMVRELFAASPITIGGSLIDPHAIECVVVRLDEQTNRHQDILAIPPLELWMKDADIERLLVAGGALDRILSSSLSALPFRIDQKCDDCRFNVHCLPDAARQRRLELLGFEPTTAEALRRAGIADIDALADLDLAGAAATAARQDKAFNESLDILSHKAKARRSTLPAGGADPDGFQVEILPFRSQSQLPAHVIGGDRLIRVYLTVHYDYTENRVGALAAHVTRSDWEIHSPTDWKGSPKKPEPRPEVVEVKEMGKDVDNHPVYHERPLDGENVLRIQAMAWSGDFNKDNAAEARLLVEFFNALVEAIKKVGGTDHQAPLHFYVWSRGEVKQCVEAFTRTGLSLHAFNQLLGCRDGPEQLIFSCLHDEIDRRYGLGWTSRGLVVAASLTWFGRRFHWTRKVGADIHDLDWVFRQDIFDFKQTLYFDSVGNWTDKDTAVGKHPFEIRSRFGDTLPAPYWRAYWGTLHFPPDADARIREQINRYLDGGRPGVLEVYLAARPHALRWFDERVMFKNREIEKAPFVINDLPTFNLGVTNVGRAAVDFLRLDHRVKLNDWVAEHLMPPSFRVLRGRSIPIGSITYPQPNVMRARMHLVGCEIDLAGIRERCDLKEGDFVRVSPCDDTGDLGEGQTIRQLTSLVGHNGRIDHINWDTGSIDIRIIPTPTGGGGYYILNSRSVNPETTPLNFATVDKSVSDFVAGRVEARLRTGVGAHMYNWFDPRNPTIPPMDATIATDVAVYKDVLTRFHIDTLSGKDERLRPEQQDVALAGLGTRVQLLQGPPGTGKTQTTAATVLLRILARRRAGTPKSRAAAARPGDIVLIAAHTHNAVDELLTRLCRVIDPFRNACTEAGRPLPFTTFAKVFSSGDPTALRTVVDKATGRTLPVQPLSADSCAARIKDYRKNGILVIGGTTSAILKMAEKLAGTAAFPSGVSVPVLIVDEASMLVFPHFLSLATLVEPDGEIMLAGDHRQLAPIVANDWETEDRPTIETFKPHLSAYEALDGMKTNAVVPDAAVNRQALSYTFRLPEIVRRLIGPTYQRDDVVLQGRTDPHEPLNYAAEPDPWKRVWLPTNGLFIVTHNERQSRRSNAVEQEVVENIVRANPNPMQADIAIISPHRAQRAVLQQRLADLTVPGGPIKVIDTVEKLQGGEASTVIVTATASDPSAIGRNVDFILSLNRANVAFSRTQNRLVVVCADSLLDHMPVDVEQYDDTVLWKTLRLLCTQEIALESVCGFTARIRTTPSDGGITAHSPRGQ
jgi:hypothetical protein